MTTAREKLDQAIREYAQDIYPDDHVISVNWVLGYEIIQPSTVGAGYDTLAYRLGYGTSEGGSMAGSIGISQATARMVLADSTRGHDNE